MTGEAILLGQTERKEKEPFSDLTIFTTTFYRGDEASQLRAELTLGTLANAQKLGIKCVVVDGGSNSEFLEKLKNFNNVTIVEEDPAWGMGGGRRAGLREAIEHATPYCLWFEPEKTNLITRECLEPMIKPLREGKVDIVVPKRTEEGMAGLPKIQKWFEERANRRATRIMYGISPGDTTKIKKGGDEEIDFWFGPKAFNPRGAKFFLSYQAKGVDKWDSIIVPVINAHKAGLIIASIGVPYTYDERQKNSEEGSRAMKQKRLDQYRQILSEMDDPFWVENLSRK